MLTANTKYIIKLTVLLECSSIRFRCNYIITVNKQDSVYGCMGPEGCHNTEVVMVTVLVFAVNISREHHYTWYSECSDVYYTK